MWKDGELERILNMEIGYTILLRTPYIYEILIKRDIGEYIAIKRNYRCEHMEQSRKTFRSDELDKLFEMIDNWV